MAQRFPDALAEVKKAWATTIRRIAAVKMRYSRFGEVGRKTLCAASLHCSKSAGTADLLAVLKDVLEEVVGKKASFIIGLDSNVPGKDASEFQDKLREMGMDFGDRPEAQQVTVAKTRTEFQTQVKKAGDTDVSHKDYLLNWGFGQRQATEYTPDLCTQFGLHRLGKTVRLPIISWPFDHAGVTAKISMGASWSLRQIGTVGRIAMRCIHYVLVLYGMSIVLLAPGKKLPAPYSDGWIMIPAVQLGFTLILSVWPRPASKASWLTECYFLASAVNNILYIQFLGGGDAGGDIMGFVLSAIPGSIGTLTILHMVVSKRLTAMGRGEGLRAAVAVEFKTLKIFLGLVALWYTSTWFGATWTNDYAFPVLVLGTIWLCACHIVISFLSFVDLFHAMQEMTSEAEEGGLVAKKGKALLAERAQLWSTIFAMGTGLLYWATGICFNCLFNCAVAQGGPMKYCSNGLVDSYSQLCQYFIYSLFFDSICNDACAHILALAVDDESLSTAKRVQEERAQRAANELREHDLACRVLQAGPTSLARCIAIRAREDAAREAAGTASAAARFAALQSLVRAEMRRIHRLYYCILLRCMLMPTRFIYLHDVRSIQGAARQPVPEEFSAEGSSGNEYLVWLHSEIKQIREQFSEQMSQAVAKVNLAIWPSELGLSSEEFPFRIWRGASRSVVKMETELSLGQVLELKRVEEKKRKTGVSFVTRIDVDKGGTVEVQPSGTDERISVSKSSLRQCRGAGVLVPGPLKLEQRCRDKIANDYEGKEPSPAAASLVDIVRAAIGFDDPYAMAVMVAYLAKEFDIVRIKNRFENDDVEVVSPERIHAEFYAADSMGGETDASSDKKSSKMYRDILINLRPRGSDFICEVQLSFTGIMILKKSEQKIYSLLRMTSADELLDTYVFSGKQDAAPALENGTSAVVGVASGPQLWNFCWQCAAETRGTDFCGECGACMIPALEGGGGLVLREGLAKVEHWLLRRSSKEDLEHFFEHINSEDLLLDDYDEAKKLNNSAMPTASTKASASSNPFTQQVASPAPTTGGALYHAP
jgi:hypothetical protein